MKCIFCQKGETLVVNSRSVKRETAVWRRRKCSLCAEVFTTEERLSYDALFVVKRNFTRKRFVYEKLFASVLFVISGQKYHDMGDAALFAKKICESIVETLLLSGSKYLSSKEIICVTYDFLDKEDHFFATKYVMYSSYRVSVIEKYKKGKGTPHSK